MSYVVQAGLELAVHFRVLGLQVRATAPGLMEPFEKVFTNS